MLQRELDVSEPTLPRKQKVPKRYEVGTGIGHYLTTSKQMFHHIYLESLDLVVSFIWQRFDQCGYRTYRHLLDLLLMAAHQENFSTEFDFVVEF